MAQAAVKVDIDLSSQTMHVESDSGASYNWPVSSARAGYATPRGYYRPQRLERMHYSRKYHNSPMPYSIFFRGGYAIHGTGAVSQLGRPASHGCIRLAPGNAATLFALVKQEGARIQITGSPPASTMFAESHGKRQHVAAARHHKRHTQYAAAQPKHGAKYAAAKHGHAAPLAYAPVAPRAPAPAAAASPFGWLFR